jgi:hypothetical protein
MAYLMQLKRLTEAKKYFKELEGRTKAKTKEA